MMRGLQNIGGRLASALLLDNGMTDAECHNVSKAYALPYRLSNTLPSCVCGRAFGVAADKRLCIEISR